MSTLRSKIIRLARDNPEVRPHLLPLLKTAGRLPFENIGVRVDPAIRSSYYKTNDGIQGLIEAVRKDPNTRPNQKLNLAVINLKEALGQVTRALDPYDWD